MDPKYFIGLDSCAGGSTATYWQGVPCQTCRRTEARLRSKPPALQVVGVLRWVATIQ